MQQETANLIIQSYIESTRKNDEQSTVMYLALVKVISIWQIL